jgi:hypothetical protein
MGKEELLDRAQFGRQIELFWGSRLGEYLLARVREEYVEALTKLKTCDPADSKLVMKLQGEAWRAESFEQWLSQAVIDGAKALELLEGEDDDE